MATPHDAESQAKNLDGFEWTNMNVTATILNSNERPTQILMGLSKLHNIQIQELAPHLSKAKAPSVSGLLATSSKKCDDGLIASYDRSKIIAKSEKAHTIGAELMLPVVKEVLETVLHHSAASNVIKKIPLSNDTVQQRNDEMTEDFEVSV
ncbi:protein FAM200C-like [Parasteatoda tepidariorum]|uniref:protein FAM200C-like n=1 Tax=Parasteatoda tepidariorum TaxID=114398 RepID=UPI0039BD1354